MSVPLGHSPDYDLIADLDGELRRVQVKTTRRRTPHGRWQVMLETKGGNQSWSGTTRRFDAGRYDWLFVLVADGRCWLIPANQIEATTSVCLGGTKYAEHEVEPGRAFVAAAEAPR